MKLRIALSLFFAGTAGLTAFAAGRQLTGQHAPATTPALSPMEAQKKFAVPEGFEVRLFAAEPDVVNPVAMTWDERGRLWVLELFEYPMGARAGAKPRDQIKILEDTNQDGRADKVTVFAAGLNLATGLLLGYGGAFVGQAPHLLFLEDTNGDDVADRRTVLLTGFGLEDRHELLNGFTWGPDGWLYMTHGVFTHSKVKDPARPDDDGVIMNAAVARFHPRTRQFEVFADGTSNPWGVDFDREGNAFVSACVIDHLFHMAPGGLYARQAGAPPHPYAYELLPSIVDHKHFRAAYAGVQVYEGDQYPAEYQGTILMGNIHDSAVHQDRLVPAGSSFKASFVRDFVRANDGWFRPVSVQVGPDGAVWLMDWYDRYPCYQNAQADPEGVDRERGRIWRVVYTGAGGENRKGTSGTVALSGASAADLVRLIEHPNVWHRRMAQRLLSERREPVSRDGLEKLAAQGRTLAGRLTALWTLHSSGLLREETIEQLARDREPGVRVWVARLSGERGEWNDAVSQRLERLAADREPKVRLAVATALRQFVSGALTVNRPAREGTEVSITPVLAELIGASAQAEDPTLEFLIWMVAEPLVAAYPDDALGWLEENGAQMLPLSAELTRKSLRRICDLRQPEVLDGAIEFVARMADQNAGLAIAALDGLLEGQKGKALLPARATSPIVEKLVRHANPQLVSRAQQLGTLWGDAAAFQSLMRTAQDGAAGLEDRIKAVRAISQTKNDSAKEVLLSLVGSGTAEALSVAAIRGLGEIGAEGTEGELLRRWKSLSSGSKAAAADVLAARRRWSLALLAAVEAKAVAAGDLSATVIRTLAQSPDEAIRERARASIGRIREADADKLKVIADKRKAVVSGPADLVAGREVARKTCFTCHKLHGEGAEVGPDLTGVGRSTLDALLANVIDPNQIIGRGYENVEVTTKDGRSVSGRLVEETDARVKLLAAGPKEEVIARSDIESMRVSELSVMPEGLEQMPDEDFRNLIWFLLNPPEDQRPMTPDLRRELLGEPAAGAGEAPRDGESVALWNPLWRVLSPDFEGAPQKLPEYNGRKNVLMTHPFSREQPAVLERVVNLQGMKQARLKVGVAAHEKGDWELRVLANDELVQRKVVTREGRPWHDVEVNLDKWAGKKLVLRLENGANNWSWEFGYWSEIHFAAE